MAAKKSTDSKTTTKRPTISSSHTTLRAPKAGKTDKASAADPRTPAKGRTTKATTAPASKNTSGAKGAKTAKIDNEPVAPKAKGIVKAKRAAALELPASKPVPKATSKSALQIAATKGKKAVAASAKAALPVPAERKDEGKRKARVRAAEEIDPAKIARERAIQIAAAGLEKKASDVAIIDVYGKVDYADFLVLMTGTSDRHVASIVQSVEDDQRKRGERALSVEGLPIANWVLVDFADVVVHVFQEHARGMYDLDGLWMDANRIPVDNGK
jgi:ribosome-associated protein